jgi:hypothetical protein
MDYELDIRIDETALDVEWLDQPSLMFRYARNAAQARQIVDRKKENLDVVKAELDTDIRTNPGEYDLEKLTEGAILNTILQQKKYRDAYKDYVDAKYEADIAQAAVVAMAQRKDALENLVRLHGQQYFAGPKMPRDVQWERQQKIERSNDIVERKLTRGKSN